MLRVEWEPLERSKISQQQCGGGMGDEVVNSLADARAGKPIVARRCEPTWGG
eukprot:Skav211120  [mRNA]  locus=scaffold2659:147601:148403:- [translate_table: standard]